MKPKILLIEDNEEDARRAVAALDAAGEEFEYHQARSLSQAFCELEFAAPNTYQKIYLDLSLKGVANNTSKIIASLSKYVDKKNIITVSDCPNLLVEKAINKMGVNFLYKNDVSQGNSLMAFVFDLQEKERDRSRERQRDLANLEIKIARLETTTELNQEQNTGLLNSVKDMLNELLEEFKNLAARVDQIEDAMLVCSKESADKQAFTLKAFELRWQFVAGLALASVGIILPKLLELLGKK